MKIVFFSDTHLDRAHEEKTRMVETFLREECRDADTVFLLGDLFEFYHGHGEYIYPWYRRIADALRDLTKSGVTVYLVEGNHEFAVGGFFESYTGVTCTNEMTVDIDGRRVFVSHGDAIAGGVVRAVLKSGLAARVMDALGPHLTWAAAMGASLFLSKRKKPYRLQVRDRFREYARMKLDEGFDAVVLAHSHIPDVVEYGSEKERKIYLNTGDFPVKSTYVVYESGSGFHLKKGGAALSPKPAGGA